MLVSRFPNLLVVILCTLGFVVYLPISTPVTTLQKMRNCNLLVCKWKGWPNPSGILNLLVLPSLCICRPPPLLLLLLFSLGRHFVKLFAIIFILLTTVKAFLLVGCSSDSSLVSQFNNLLRSSPSSASNSIFKILKRYLLSNLILVCCPFYVGKRISLTIYLLIKPSLVL